MYVHTNIKHALTDVEASQFLGLCPQTLRNWRCQMRGPAYHRMGRRVVYTLDDLETYRDRNRIDPEAAAA